MTHAALPHLRLDESRQVLPAYYRMREVLRITGLSRPTVYRRIAANRFPPPVHLGGRACGWSSASLQHWIEDPDGYVAPAAKAEVASMSSRAGR